jgi:hypothetical protein
MKKFVILLATLVLVTACGKKIDEADATRMIEESKEFSERATTQLYTGENVSQDYTFYAGMMTAVASGLIHCDFPPGAEEGSCTLTGEGEAASRRWTSEAYGAWTIWHVPTATKKVTNVKVVKVVGNEAEVDFWWEWEPTAFGRQSQQVPNPGPQPSKARFVETVEGEWRFDRFTVGP